jgi:hypothetical protein
MNKKIEANLKILFCFVEDNICRHRLLKRIILARRFGFCSFSVGNDDDDGLFILDFKTKISSPILYSSRFLSIDYFRHCCCRRWFSDYVFVKKCVRFDDDVHQ